MQILVRRSLVWAKRASKAVPLSAGMLGSLFLCGCQGPSPPPPPGSAVAIQPPSALATVPVQSLAQTVDEYKRDVASAIYRTSPNDLFEGAPPPQLRAVVVLFLRIDQEGKLARVAVLRSNGYRELEDIAVTSVRRATPLPLPSRQVARNGAAEFVETWLFRDDGRFQIRSLAQVQATLDD